MAGYQYRAAAGGSASGGLAPDTNETESSRTEAAATLTNAATAFYVWDQVGSIRLVTGGAGNLITLHDYEPYGVEILPNTPTPMPTDALPGTVPPHRPRTPSSHSPRSAV